MSNTINPYGTSRPELQRAVQPSELDEEGLALSPAGKGETEHLGPNEKGESAARELSDATEAGLRVTPRFDSTLEGALDRIDAPAAAGQKNVQNLEGLTPAEQQLIYRYFPESPSLELRLYKPDMSTNKVDPGSVGSRVDLRG